MQTLIHCIGVAITGVPTTLGVSLGAVIIGTLLGLGLALLRTSKIKILAILSQTYVEIFRGTPMIAQALLAAFGIPILLQSNGVDFHWAKPLIPALIVCGLNSAAYMAEVIRSGIQAVDKGQIEAASSLGMSKKQIQLLVVLPQAFKIVLPSISNEFIALIKETAILSYVGVLEILGKTQLYIASTFNTFPAYIAAALVYLMITFPLSKGVGLMEKKLKKEGV